MWFAQEDTRVSAFLDAEHTLPEYQAQAARYRQVLFSCFSSRFFFATTVRNTPLLHLGGSCLNMCVCVLSGCTARSHHASGVRSLGRAAGGLWRSERPVGGAGRRLGCVALSVRVFSFDAAFIVNGVFFLSGVFPFC